MSVKRTKKIEQDAKILKYLKTLSKEKLIKLLIEEASENFKKEILLKDAPNDEVNRGLKKISLALKSILQDEALLYAPEEFQEEISRYMGELQAFVNQNPKKVIKIVFDLALEIGELEDNGYLWIDHYHNEEYFDSDIFSDEIMALIHKIEDKEAQLTYFMKFEKFVNTSGNMSFSYEALGLKDKTPLLAYFDEDSSLAFYHYIEALLSYEEKEEFLLYAGSVKTLISFYIENNKENLAIEKLEYLLKEKFKLEYVQRLLTLTNITKERLRDFISQAIETNTYGGFNFIVDGFKKLESIEDLETLWKEKNLSQYYNYLEKEQRVEEMYALLNTLPEKREAFLQKHKLAYREEALDFFNAQVTENLKSTGDGHYKKIADALRQLKALIEKEEFKSRVEALKLEYKRRRNFVAILANRFG